MGLLSSLSTFFSQKSLLSILPRRSCLFNLDMKYAAHFLPTKVYWVTSVSFQSRLLLRKKTPPDATAGDART